MRWGPGRGGPAGLCLAPVPRRTPHLVGVLAEDVLRLQVPVGDACRENEGRWVGSEAGRPAGQGLWAGWQEGSGTQRSRPPPTFVVQEIQGAGHVLHHHASLQLVEVPALVDVAQDGAWPREDTGDGRVTVRPGHSAAPAPPGTEAPAQPPRAKVFNLSCCVARKLRLHEPSLPRKTL